MFISININNSYLYTQFTSYLSYLQSIAHSNVRHMLTIKITTKNKILPLAGNTCMIAELKSLSGTIKQQTPSLDSPDLIILDRLMHIGILPC